MSLARSSLYFISRGILRVWKDFEGKANTRQVLVSLEENDFFGEDSILSDGVAKATVECFSFCELLVLTKVTAQDSNVHLSICMCMCIVFRKCVALPSFQESFNLILDDSKDTRLKRGSISAVLQAASNAVFESAAQRTAGALERESRRERRSSLTFPSRRSSTGSLSEEHRGSLSCMMGQPNSLALLRSQTDSSAVAAEREQPAVRSERRRSCTGAMATPVGAGDAVPPSPRSSTCRRGSCTCRKSCTGVSAVPVGAGDADTPPSPRCRRWSCNSSSRKSCTGVSALPVGAEKVVDPRSLLGP